MNIFKFLHVVYNKLDDEIVIPREVTLKVLSNVVQVAIALAVGYLISYYFYLKGKPEITYGMKDVTLIFDNSEKSNFQLVYSKDTLTINEKVWSSTVQIWNSGDSEIPIDKVRQELKILPLEPKATILDYRLLSKKPEFRNDILLELKDNALFIKCSFFDPNDALEIQIFYSSLEYTTFELEGIISQTQLRKVVPSNRDMDKSWKVVFYSCLTLGVLGLIFHIYFPFERKVPQSKISHIFYFFSRVIQFLLFLALSIFSAVILFKGESFPF